MISPNYQHLVAELAEALQDYFEKTGTPWHIRLEPKPQTVEDAALRVARVLGELTPKRGL